MRSRSNGGVIGAYALPTQNGANGVFFIHDAAIFNTGVNPIWPLASGFIYSATGGTITTAVDNANYKLHTFTSNGTFTVVTGSGYIEILLVGGGGGSGGVAGTTGHTGASGAGGAGAVVLATNVWVNTGTTFTIERGDGGVAGSSGNFPGGTGGPSKVTATGYSYIARGGLGGAGSSSNGGSGNSNSDTYYGSGSGGAYSLNGFSFAETAPPAGSSDSMSPGSIAIYQNSGGAGTTPNSPITAGSGGGGGAGSAGYPGYYSTNTSLSAYGGDGWLWSRTNLRYGPGGPGRAVSTLKSSGLYGADLRYTGSVPSNYGAGAPSLYASTTSIAGAAGGTGVVIIAYRYK